MSGGNVTGGLVDFSGRCHGEKGKRSKARWSEGMKQKNEWSLVAEPRQPGTLYESKLGLSLDLGLRQSARAKRTDEGPDLLPQSKGLD